MPHALLACVVAGTLCTYPEVLWSEGAVDIIYDVAVDPDGDELLYGATGATGLTIWNTTVVGQEGVVGRLDTGTARKIAVFGKTAYLADGKMGVAVVDVRSPERPVLLGGLEATDTISGIVAGPGVVYVLQADGVRVMDVSSPPSPSLLATIPLAGCTCFDIAGTTLYVSHAAADVAVIDVSNPLAPTVLGSIGRGSGYTVTAIRVDGGTAYLGAKGNMSLVIVDVTTPAAPARLGSALLDPNTPYGILADGPTVYLMYRLALQAVDVSTPTAPAVLDVTSVWTFHEAIAKRPTNPTLYVASRDTGVRVLSVSDPSKMIAIGTYPESKGLRAVAVAGDMAYIAREQGLEAYNISNPRAPVKVYDDKYQYADYFSIDQDILAIEGVGGLTVYNISTGTPVKAGKYSIREMSTSVKQVGSIAYVTSEYELSIIDVRQMTKIGSYPAPAFFANAVDVVGTTAYCTWGYTGLVVLDVSNSSQPVLLGQIPASRNTSPSGNMDITVKGDYAYVAAQFSMLIMDVSDKANPKLLSKYAAGGTCLRVAVVGSTAYLSCHGSGLHIVDVTSAATPRLLAICESPGNTLGAAVAGSTLYVADVGLWIYDLSNAPTLSPVSTLTPTAEPAVPTTLVPVTTAAPVTATIAIEATAVPPVASTSVPVPGVTKAPETAVPKKSDDSNSGLVIIIVVVVVVSVLAVAAGVGLYCTRRRRTFFPQVANNAQMESLSGYESPGASQHYI